MHLSSTLWLSEQVNVLPDASCINLYPVLLVLPKISQSAPETAVGLQLKENLSLAAGSIQQHCLISSISLLGGMCPWDATVSSLRSVIWAELMLSVSFGVFCPRVTIN